MKNLMTALTVLLTVSMAHASATRILDGQAITNGAATLTLPTSTDTIVGRASTDTLTNKTMSGASNTFSNISLTASVTGLLPIANGGTNASSASSARTNLGAAASGANSDITSLSSLSTALSVAQGGTGATTLTSNNVLLGNGTSSVQFVAPGTSGNVLTSNGTTWTSAAASTPAPSLNGGSGSAQNVTAAGGVALTSLTYQNFAWIIGSPGAVTVTATPSITAGTADGQILHVVGTDNTKTVTLQDQANLASSGLSLNGNWIGAKDSTLTLHWDATQSLWIEDSRR